MNASSDTPAWNRYYEMDASVQDVRPETDTVKNYPHPAVWSVSLTARALKPTNGSIP